MVESTGLKAAIACSQITLPTTTVRAFVRRMTAGWCGLGRRQVGDFPQG